MNADSTTLDAILADMENQELRANLERRRERGRRRRERERAARRNVFILAALVIALGAIIVLRITATPATAPETDAATVEVPPQDVAEAPTDAASYVAPPETTPPLLETAPTEWAEDPETPLTEAEITEALLAQGYLSIAVPMPFEYQDYMRTYCAAYGCPYPLALAVAEAESQFNMDAVGALGEVGIMQLNPGPGGAYHAELERATGMDPTTSAGNIAGGCYLLGKYMNAYGDATKAVMAYSMGETGARKAWAAGVTSTAYSREILEAMERWECTVNAWNGV